MDIEEYRNEITPEMMELLLDADPNKEAVLRYFDISTKFIAKEGNTIVGVIVLLVTPLNAEIKNISVVEKYRCKGIGSKLIAEAIKYSKSRKLGNIIIGTCNSSLDQLRLYQSHGFRICDVVVGYFDSYPGPIFENGIQCRDQVLLRYEL